MPKNEFNNIEKWKLQIPTQKITLNPKKMNFTHENPENSPLPAPIPLPYP